MAEIQRPDPNQGVFETLLVADGRPVELDAHLARLAASLAELFPDQPPPPLEVPTENDLGVLRITVAPDGEGALEAQITQRELSPGTAAVSLHSLRLAGGLGAHKWTDRSLLDGALAKLPGNALPLIVDDDGAVLETSRANVFAVRDGALFTPPLDGRILPGITRMRVVEMARSMDIELCEKPLARGDLLTADEVFLTGSVRGIECVREVDGTVLSGGGEIAAALAAELWRSWRGVGVGS